MFCFLFLLRVLDASFSYVFLLKIIIFAISEPHFKADESLLLSTSFFFYLNFIAVIFFLYHSWPALTSYSYLRCQDTCKNILSKI